MLSITYSSVAREASSPIVLDDIYAIIKRSSFMYVHGGSTDLTSVLCHQLISLGHDIHLRQDTP